MSIFKKFTNIENEYDLFGVKIKDINIWDKIRYNVYRDIRKQMLNEDAQASTNKSIYNNVKAACKFLYNTFNKNPFSCKKSEYFVVGHSRRKKLSNGKWWDIYFDPIDNKCKIDYSYFEYPHLLEHKNRTETKHVKYLDIDNIISNIPYVDKIICKLKYNTEKVKYIDEVFERNFSEKINISDIVGKYLYRRHFLLPIYKRIINDVNPDVLIVVVSYSKSILIEASKDLGIPVLELQHGVINDEHPGYSFPHSQHVPSFPDYLLTFGPYWTEGVDVPLSDDRIIPVGYPFLEFQKNQLDHGWETSESIVFISQRTIGTELSRVALALEKSNSYEGDVRYKLHPSEYENWHILYPWLVDSKVEVITDTDVTLYKLFTQADAQVGVNSTALYEGMYFGLQTYLLEVRNYSLDQKLLQQGYAKKVANVNDLENNLEGNSREYNANDMDDIFLKDPFGKVCGVLSNLATHGSVFKA